jgi:PAS domain S-box-containing protein
MKLKRPDILIMGFAVALALLGGVAWSDWRHTARTQETAELVARTHEVQANSSRLLSLIQDIETGERGFVVTGDPAFLKPFESALKAVGEQQRKLEQLIRDAEQKVNWSALEPLIAEHIVLAQRMVDLRQNAGFEAARQEVASGRGKAVMDKIRAEFAQMDAKEQTLLDQRSAAAKREASAAQRRTGFGTSLSLVLLIAVFALLLRENRLRQRVQEQMAGNIKALADFKAALDEHAIVAITDACGKITYVNDKFCAISKYAREELLGQDHRLINSGHHPKTLIRELWQTVGSGRVWKGEFKSRAKDGTFFWLDTSIVPFLDEHGKPTQYITIRTDITGRKREEENLRRMATVVRDSNDAITIQDFAGRITAWNHGAELMYGYGEAEALQMNIGRLTPANRAEEQKNFTRRLLAGEAITSLETQRVTKDGRILDVWMTVTKLVDDAGKPIGIASTERDITARKNAEAQLQRTLADLERSNKELEQFAYVASHDLQEPLRMISSYTQLLAKRYESQLDEKARRYVNYTVDGVIRMQALINDLLTYSRAGTRGRPLEATDTHALLGEAVRNLTTMIAETHALITNDDLPTVRADASQLVLVFQNLLANAIKFRRAGLPHIHVSAQDRGREWVFAVKDDGIGIEPQHAERVFVIFQRLHTREEYPGTGIGLAVCKRIVERHGGKIWFESEPGHGTTFFFTLSK